MKQMSSFSRTRRLEFEPEPSVLEVIVIEKRFSNAREGEQESLIFHQWQGVSWEIIYLITISKEDSCGCEKPLHRRVGLLSCQSIRYIQYISRKLLVESEVAVKWKCWAHVRVAGDMKSPSPPGCAFSCYMVKLSHRRSRTTLPSSARIA